MGGGGFRSRKCIWCLGKRDNSLSPKQEQYLKFRVKDGLSFILGCHLHYQFQSTFAFGNMGDADWEILIRLGSLSGREIFNGKGEELNNMSEMYPSCPLSNKCSIGRS